MSRSVPPWIGATDDTPIPPRVKLRVFERFEGKCYCCQRKITPGDKWDCDHIVALVNKGENAEYNLAPMLVSCHSTKSRSDLAEKAMVYSKKLKHIGIRKKSQFACGRDSQWKKKVDGTVVRR